MSSSERHLDGDFKALEMCRGIGSTPDSGFSDIFARSSIIGEVSDSISQDSFLQSSFSYGLKSPLGRSPNQEAFRSWRPLQRSLVVRPTSFRSVMSGNSGRAFRPRSAPLALSGFSLLEDDEDADDEISDNDPSPSNKHQPQPNHTQAQSINNPREHSPPPPAVFIPPDRRRKTGNCAVEMCRCIGGRPSSSSSRFSNSRQQPSSDTRSVATQTFVPSFLAACPRPTPHRRLFAAVRPQSAPLQEEEEEEEYEEDGTEGAQKKTHSASWGAHREPPSPAMSEAAGVTKNSVLDPQPCCHFCSSRSSLCRPHSPQQASQSSSVFAFGDDLLDLLDECGSASSPCYRVLQPHTESTLGVGEVRSPDHDMLHEVTQFLEAPQRPAFVRLRSASAPIEAKDCEDAPRLLNHHIRRRPRRHSYNYENLISIAQRMADIGDAFEMERRSFHESSHRRNSLQWLSSSLIDIVSRPIGALRDLWASGSIDTRGEEER